MIKAASAMPSIVGEHEGAFAERVRSPGCECVDYADPLEFDHPNDAPLSITNRQLSRLLFIAADTAARFERERCPTDPMTWLFSPRHLFGGLAAATACKERSNFVRTIVLHGLSIGFDADPQEIDELLEDDPFDLGISSDPPLAVVTPSSADLPG